MPKLKQTKNWTVSQIDGGELPVHKDAFKVVCNAMRSVCKRFDVGDAHLYLALLGEAAVTTQIEADVPYTGIMMPQSHAVTVAGGCPEGEDEDSFLASIALFTVYAGIAWAQNVLGQSDVLDEADLEKIREDLMFQILKEDWGDA